MKTAQWNVGGCKIRKKTSDPTKASSYDLDGINQIILFLSHQDPDIITLQETHSNDKMTQAKYIAVKLDYKYWVNDVYAKSHLEKGQGLGQAIISKYPINTHNFTLFKNPKFEAVWDDGDIAISHDKGVTSVELNLPKGAKLLVQTLHMIPFRPFNIDPSSEIAKPVLDDVQKKILKASKKPKLLQGDFNLNSESIKGYMDALFIGGYSEYKQKVPTTPKGRHYDHILFDGLKIKSSVTHDSALTDHFPIITMFY